VEKVSAPTSGVAVSTTNNWSAVYITLTKEGKPLTEEDFRTYRYIELNVYAEEEGTSLLLMNQPFATLTQGANTVRVSTWDILMQTTKSSTAYDYATGETYFQIAEGGRTVIFGAMTGIIDSKAEVPNGNVGEAYSSYLLNNCGVFPEGHQIGWYIGTSGTASVDTTTCKEGTTSYKVVANANNYITLSLRHADTAEITKEELLAFDYLALDVYNAEAKNINLFLYDDVAGILAPGWNTVKIPKSVIETQINKSEEAFEANGVGIRQYVDGHFYLVVYEAATLYFDNVRGVNDGVVDLGNVFILGDSYSTFEEYIPYITDTAWYRNTPAFVTNVDNVAETWWWQTLAATNSNLLLNASYSGTTMCNTGYTPVTGQPAPLGNAKHNSFTTRLQEFIDDGYFTTNKVDTFFLFGGTNDIWANADNKYDIGAPKYSGWTDDDLNYIIPAFCYLINQIKTNVNPTRLVVIINDELAAFDATAVEKYKEVCAHYGVGVVELSGVSKQSGHPDEAGMTTIKEQVIDFFKQ